MNKQAMYAPRDEKNPWGILDTWMNADEWKEVSRWYPFSLRSLMLDGRWFEQARCKSRDSAYEIMPWAELYSIHTTKIYEKKCRQTFYSPLYLSVQVSMLYKLRKEQ